MIVPSRLLFAAAALLTLLAGRPLSAQEVALKGGLTYSSFETSGAIPFTQSLVATSFGAHFRFRLGPVAVQPEIHLVTRGAATSADGEFEERLRLEYLELPVMLVVPFVAGSFEPYLHAGPMIALESRCRSIVIEQGLRTNFGCEQTAGTIFDRHTIDYGVSGGAGVAHPLAGGKVLVEGRYTMGMRNIYADEDGFEVRNRTFQLSLGYVINVDREP